jgi:hypothetical protein
MVDEDISPYVFRSGIVAVNQIDASFRQAFPQDTKETGTPVLLKLRASD